MMSRFSGFCSQGVIRGAVFAVVLSMLFPSMAAGQSKVTIVNNGSPDNRVDIAVLGDGYAAGELAKFSTDVDNLIAGFLGEEPLREYRNYFNVHRIDVVSNESGVDHPAGGIFHDTALGAYYDCFDIPRLICIDQQAVQNVVSSTLSQCLARKELSDFSQL